MTRRAAFTPFACEAATACGTDASVQQGKIKKGSSQDVWDIGDPHFLGQRL
jgi:hypothetical protein